MKIRRPRKIATRRASKTATGEFHPISQEACQEHENAGEYSVLAILDADPSVEEFASQPETFSLQAGSTYTPKALIIYRGGRRVYVDVKTAIHFAQDPDFGGRLEEIIDAAAERSANFEVWTEQYYDDSVRRYNAEYLRHSRRRSSALHVDMVHSLLEHGALSLTEIERVLDIGSAARFAAIALCAHGRAVFDRAAAIGPRTVVRLARGKWS